MEPKRTLHSGNLVRGVHAGDRKLFILLKDGVHKIDMNQKTQQEGYRNFNLEEEERFIKKLVDAEVAYTGKRRAFRF